MNSENILNPPQLAKIIIRSKRPENANLNDIMTKYPPFGWEQVFQSSQDELSDVNSILTELKESYLPYDANIFKAFDCCPLDKIKVVIIGQDPYHTINSSGHPIANGMSFSVNRGNRIPPSLMNIYREIGNSVKEFKIPNHGDLTNWCRQGVLMLNTCLTVKPHQAGSHGQIWLGFIQKVIEAISVQNPHCIYVMWGKKAQVIEKMIRGKPTFLKSAHPSPFSAHKGFFGNNHFARINDILVSLKKEPIDWQI